MLSDSLDPISSQNLNDLISLRLREFIIKNKLHAGNRLPSEGVLAQRLGVSRTALREAFRTLEALGVVEARQGVGRVVCEFSFKPLLNTLSYGLAFHSHNILRSIEIRQALDAFFIEAAIHNISDEDIATLTALAERMRVKGAAGLTLTDEDYAFHLLLFQRAGNPLALELFEITWTIRLNVLTQDLLLELPPGTASDHLALLDAIKARDIPRAREILTQHHWNTITLFRERIQRETSRASSD